MGLAERKRRRRQKQIVLRILFAATLFRLFLFWKIPVSYWTEQVYDDQLMYQLAVNLADFQWLGKYSYVTLVKSISYPLFVAACHWIRIPYSIAIGILCIGSAVAFVKAIERLVPSFIWRAAFYLLILYSPIGFKSLVTQRTYQMALVPYAVILVFACMIALFLRRDEVKSLQRWGIGGALCLPFFYYIRDDSIWIMPFVLTVTVVTLGCLWQKSRRITRETVKKAVWVMLPILSLGVVTLGICTVNYVHYKEFATSERTGSEFAGVMDRLYRIEDDASPDVWCSNDAIAKAIDASPALESIEEEILEQERNWSRGTNKDMKGDMPMWVMRSALNDAGYFKSSSKMRKFCGRVVEELDEAFEDGTLKEDGLLHLSSVQIQKEYIQNGKYRKDFRKYFTGVLYYEGGVSQICKMGISTGKLPAIREWEDFYNSNTTYPAKFVGKAKEIKDSFSVIDYIVQFLVNIIHILFKIAGRLLGILAAAGFLYITAALTCDRRHIEMWLCIAGMLLSSVLLVAVVVFFCSWFDAKMEHTVYMYLAGAYPLLQIAKYLTIYQSLRLLSQRVLIDGLPERHFQERSLRDRLRRR